MPSRASDILRTFIGIAQLQQGWQQLDDARSNARIAGINTFMTLARQTANPSELTALVDRFSQLGVGSREQLLSILQNVTPTTEAVTAGQTKAGVDVAAGKPTGKGAEADALARRTANAQLTGQNAGQLAAADFIAGAIERTPMTDVMAAATTSKLATGMSPGQLVLDAAITALPQDERVQAAGVGVGTRLSAPQDATLGHAYATLRETARHNRVGEALMETGQMVDLANAKARAGAGAIPDASNVASLITAKGGMIKQLTETKDNPPPGLVISYLGALNAINRQLDMAGVPNEGQIPYDPQLLTDPTWFEALKRRLAGGASQPIVRPNTPPARPVPGAAAPHRRSTGAGRDF